MNIGKILLSKKSVSGHNSSNISKKKKKKKKKMESEKRKSSRENMVQKLYDTCKQIFANGKAGYVPPLHDIQRLTSLLDSLVPKDFKFTTPSLEFSSTNPPGTVEAPLVTYIKIHECNKFSVLILKSSKGWKSELLIVERYCINKYSVIVQIGIFCLPPSGVIPLHNHPGMTVFSKLLAGTMHATSYDWMHNHDHQANHYRGEQESRMRLAKVYVDADFTAPCKSSVLFPESGGNMHCFKALTPCILLDVLGPPYSEPEGRHCTYYQHYSYDHISFSDVNKEMKMKEDETRSYAWLEERKDEQFVVLGGTYDGPTIKL